MGPFLVGDTELGTSKGVNCYNPYGARDLKVPKYLIETLKIIPIK